MKETKTKTSPKKAPAKKAPASATQPTTTGVAPSRKVSSEREYVLAAARTLLGNEPHFVVEQIGETLTSRNHGKVVMTFHIEGNESVYRFQKAQDLTELTKVLHHYVPLTEPPDWLEFRCPATRDPRPVLEALLGQVIGKLRRELIVAGS